MELQEDSEDTDRRVVIVAKKTIKPKRYTAEGETEPEATSLPQAPDESKWDIIYCLPFFAKPGRHTYMIKYKNSDEKF